MQVARRFDLGERIGGGDTADVYRAFDHELGRDVVVRFLRADAPVDEELVGRFHREAEAASGIRHPNVVEVLDHGVVDGRPFLVRELIQGSTLEDMLERRGALPEEEARALAEQIGRGLEAAHARGVLHRDLNAGNVFVTPDGTAKVAGFGMPTAPRHPAPEQTAGKQIDERADVYGLGVLLDQMTGQRVSKRIKAVVLRARDTDPARRYPTASAMAEALAARTAPIAWLAPVAPPPVRRRGSALPLVLLGLPLLLALAIAALALARPTPTETAVLSATTTPQATVGITTPPAPTSLPPVETTPEPAPEAPAAAAPAPAPEAPAAVVPAPVTPAAATVRSFYELIEQRRFDDAAALWSPRMRASYPPSTNIYGRFDRTRQIVIRSITPVAPSAGGAAVAIDILEVLDSGVTRRWVGRWHLVWDGSRWLMDAPSLRAA